MLGDSEVPSVESMSAGFLNRLLAQVFGGDVDIRSVRSERVGNGLMALTNRLQIDYTHAPPDAPRTFILKSTAQTETSRRTGKRGFGFPKRLGFYAAEVQFYREIAPKSSVSVPRCYASWLSPDCDEFALLLEDLRDAKPGDEIAGCSLDEAAAALRNVARLHAAFWNDDTALNCAWAPVRVDEAESYERKTQRNIDAVLARWGAAIQPEDRVVLEMFADRAGAWFEGAGHSHTVVHNDFRLDNILFAPQSAETGCVLVDWQTAMRGNPGRDVGLLVGASLSDELFASSLDELLAAYHDELINLGVGDYSFGDAYEEMRRGLFQALHNAVTTSQAVELTPRGQVMVEQWLRRSCGRIRAMGSTDLLER